MADVPALPDPPKPRALPPPRRPRHVSPRPAWWCWVILGLATALVLYRGSYRAILPGESSDFALMYQASHGWVHGVSPYDPVALDPFWLQAGGPDNQLNPTVRGKALFVYPPTTFALLAPLTELSWPAAKTVWMCVNTLALFTAVAVLVRIAGLRGRSAVLTAAGALVMAPAHTAIFVGQPAVIILACIVFALGARVTGRPVLAGLFLGVSCAVKPQVGLIFLAYEVGRLRWRVAAAAGITIAVVAAVGVLRLELAGIDWFPQWRANLEAFTASDNADPTAANPLRYHLINLHYWFHTFTDNRSAVSVLVFAVVAALALAYYLADRNRRRPANDLQALSMAAAVSMLIVYHRAYDATVLLIPFVWAAERLHVAVRSPRSPVFPPVFPILLLAPFFVPGAAALNKLASADRVPWGLDKTAIWDTVLMPHAVIALLLIAMWLTWCRHTGIGDPD